MKTISFQQLPAIRADLDGGMFAGVTTLPDGTHCAVTLLPAQGSDLDWKAAKAWAAEQGGVLPNRPVAALLFANLKQKLRPQWHWTDEQDGASFAWVCTFGTGFQGYYRQSFEGSAVAVRLIPLTA